MCGICGVIDSGKLSYDIGMKMVKSMIHRGPDSQDVKIYPDQLCMLGHARLSIIDLSSEANQPLEYGQYVIVFNGEIYNYKEIRQELMDLGHSFRLNSDTEVIVHAFEEWGKDCVQRFIGMFAFAILDRISQKLILFRDRAGVKPLYYYEKDGFFMFGSELKVFYPYPKFHKIIRKEAVAAYMKYGYVPAPIAIYENTWKLDAGHIMEYDINKHEKHICKYWDVMDYYQQPRLDIGYQDAKNELENILVSAFNYRMVADVPVGVFLSGGYDSALLTTLLQKDRTEKLKTFTIGFENNEWNEAPAAKVLANLLGTDHHEYIFSQHDCKEIIPQLSYFYDEPFADNSAVPTILVSRLAKTKVKVALSADGGDETFAGYNRYGGLYNVENILKLIKNVKSRRFSSTVKKIGHIVIPHYTFTHEKFETFAQLLGIEPQYRVSLTASSGSYSTLSESVYHEICRMDFPESHLLDERLYDSSISVATAMDYIDYMTDDILVKVDRATMSTSLEGREPLLDHRIIEYAAKLPISFKFDHGIKKRIYKDILYQYVPKDIMERPKKGFMMPVDDWLRGDLKYLLDEHLGKSLNSDYFNVEKVESLKKMFLGGKLKHENKIIWRILVFQLWYAENFK